MFNSQLVKAKGSAGDNKMLLIGTSKESAKNLVYNHVPTGSKNHTNLKPGLHYITACGKKVNRKVSSKNRV